MPNSLERYRPDNLPDRSLAGKLWTAFPTRERQALEESLKGLPLDRNPLNMLIDLAIIHYKSTFGRQKRVAILGPANVGKSTLFNQFVRQKSERAEVSPVPGTTRVNQMSDAGLFVMADTPGADAIGPTGQEEHDIALSAAESADFLILVFDAIQGVKQTELALFHEIISLQKPFVIVLNKIDLARRYKAQVIESTAQNLGVQANDIVAVSALRGEGISQILMSIIAADPSMTVSLATAMPQYRRKLALRAVTTSGALAAAIALTPLPVLDFVPLVATQAGLVISVARIYQYRITVARAKELLASYGLGLLGRTLFQQLSKLGGIPGWLLSSAIAASMTVAIGYASIEWFEKGEKLSSAQVADLSKRLAGRLAERLKSTLRKKPKKEDMERLVIDILESETMPDSPESTPPIK